jgi:hypothetical protein
MKGTRAIALVGGLILAATGTWAFFGARSFYDTVATFPPYNEHFIHDIGAFTLGLGAVLMLAAVWADALLVVLAGNAVGASFHAASHVLDADVTGAGTPILTVVFALVLALAAIWRWRETSR